MRSGVFVQALLVGAGGFVGSVLRYAAGGAVHRLVPFATFPWGTLLVNATGCVAIGLLAGLAESRQVLGPEARLFLMLGLLGGFTTFSTFGYETFTLLREAQHLRAIGGVLAHVAIALAGVWVGDALSRLW